jgi:bifunctional enzyme CysN/CysC
VAHKSDMIADDILGYLKEQENKGFLRFITCGSVDDGKSTLIGRLLYDSKLIFEDQMSAIEADSKVSGNAGEEVDLALLVDGLAAEREQGITIDVAYRFFSTDKRKFIVADTPGHEQYTRNMATGASTAELAVILIDARKGILTQTRRHSFICSLIGIRHIILAVNKMDLVDFDQGVFDKIEKDYRAFAENLDFTDITAIPMSALTGENVLNRTESLNWFDGPTLMEKLETVEVHEDLQSQAFRLPVQWVNRPNLDFRGFSGTIASGTLKAGDKIIALPSGRRSTVKEIVTYDGALEEGVAGQAVTLTLDDEIDISRGDIICANEHPAEISDQFGAHLIWMSEDALLPGRPYLLKTGNQTLTAMVSELKHKVNVNSLEKQAGKTLELNEVGVCHISMGKPIAFDPYRDNRSTGSFVLIDRQSNTTVGAGTLDFPLRRASNIIWQDLDVDKASRAELKHQMPCILWFTGYSGSGKSTVANLVEQKLLVEGRHTYTLDGDNVRHGLTKDLGFTDAGRVENIRRVGEVSKLMVDAGLIVLVSFISPFKSERRLARDLVEDSEFIEVFVDTPIEVCEQRDTKGLYKKARAGEIKNFTGIDSAYEIPENPELVVKTDEFSAEECADQIIVYLKNKGYLSNS